MGEVSKPAIERPKPIIHDVSSAMDDSICAMERVLAVVASASSDLMEQVVNSAHPDHAVKRAFDIWMVLHSAQEALDRLYTDFAEINEALPGRVEKRVEKAA